MTRLKCIIGKNADYSGCISQLWLRRDFCFSRMPTLIEVRMGLLIGVVLAPPNGRPVRISRLDVRWHCVNDFFALERRSTRVRLPRPVLDC